MPRPISLDVSHLPYRRVVQDLSHHRRAEPTLAFPPSLPRTIPVPQAKEPTAYTLFLASPLVALAQHNASAADDQISDKQTTLARTLLVRKAHIIPSSLSPIAPQAPARSPPSSPPPPSRV